MIEFNRAFLYCDDFMAVAPSALWCDGDEGADYVVSGNCYEWYLSYPMRLRRAPARILEIGIRYGYSAVTMMTGALQRSRFVEYWGFDDGSYGVDPMDQVERIASFFEPWSVGLVIRKMNTQSVDHLNGVVGLFDIIHVDALHTEDGEGEAHDLRLVAHLLHDDGIIIVDDATDGRSSMMDIIPRVGEELGFNWAYAPTFRGNIILFRGDIGNILDIPEGATETQ